jgi:acyl-CoA-binding protein
MPPKSKLKFGTYSVEASVQIEDNLDLEDHFTREEWDKMKPREQEEWMMEYIESLAISDLETKWKLDR